MVDIAIVLEHFGTQQRLRLTADPNAPASTVHELVSERLSRPFGTFALRSADRGEILSEVGTVGDLCLLHGERLVVEDRYEASQAAPASSTEVEVIIIEGPHTGQMFRLGDSFEVGRRVEGGVRLDKDETASRRHARMEVVGGQLVITDLGSTNGTLVDGTLIDGPTRIEPAQHVRVGDTVLTAAKRAGLHELAHLRYEDGRLLFNRPARKLRRRPAVVTRLPDPPEEPQRRRVPKAAILGPALLGIPVYLFTQNPLTLIMVLGSPLLALFSWIDDRVSGRKDYRVQRAAYQQELERLGVEAHKEHERSRAWRAARNPAPSEVVRRAVDRNPEVWQRDIAHDDFLELRVGELDQPSLSTVTVPTKGEESLLARAQEIAEAVKVDPAAPVVIPLGRPVAEEGRSAAEGEQHTVNVIGLVGSAETTAAMARWLVLQLAVHHSPQDLALSLALRSGADAWRWASWLPHLEQLAGDDDTDAMLATDEHAASQLFKGLRSYAENRVAAAKQSYSGGVRYRPHVVLVAELPLRVADSELTAFLDQLAEANMSSILLAPDRRMLPRQADVVVVLDEHEGTKVEFVRADRDMEGVVADTVSMEDAARAARALAPLRDTSTPGGGGAAIPARVNLLEMLGLVPLTVDAVLDRWRNHPAVVTAPIGLDSSGVLSVQLAPHGLVGGTTGAGKSELLQTYVASLALTFPPERLNFVFVDFKGGLAFKQCVDLPHAVGLITNLDGHLAGRVMKSLQAELDKRTQLINSLGGGDLATLSARHPERCPPALVIIFDEFREAVERVPSLPGEPSFIERVMSLARLGRQVGMHVILATQTPEGVVTEDLKNNVDLRIALRVKTTDASRSIIGQPDAALISNRSPGRGYVQLEAGDVREMQAAFVGGISALPEDGTVGPSLYTYDASRAIEQLARSGTDGKADSTDLEAIVRVVGEAAARRGSPKPAHVWHPELPPVMPLRDVLRYAPTEGAGRLVLPIARSDDPSQQTQDWYLVDLGRAGAMIAYGGAGSGKSSLLRTIAVAASARLSPEELHLYAADFTGFGLGALSALPHTATVVSGRETDRLRQLVAVLRRQVEDRLALLGESGAGSIIELNRSRKQQLPLLLLLIDGWFQMAESYADLPGDSLYEDFIDLISNGRAAGLHTVATAHRSGLVPSVASMFPLSLVLRMNTRDDYSNLGLRELTELTSFPPGRAFTPDGLELQVGVLCEPHLEADATAVDVAEQNRMLQTIGRRLRDRMPGVSAPPLRALPDVVSMSELPNPAARSLQLPIGLDEVAVQPLVVDFGRTPTLLVVGPEESGRTSALAAVADRFAVAWPKARRHLLTGRRSPLADHTSLWTSSAHGAESVAAFLADLTPEMKRRSAEGFDEPILLVIDDADGFGENPVRMALDDTQLLWRDAGVLVAVAMTTFAASKMYAPWLRSMAAARQGLLLQPDLANDGQLFDSRLPARTRLELPPGRGFLLTRAGYTLVQVARPEWLR